MMPMRRGSRSPSKRRSAQGGPSSSSSATNTMASTGRAGATIMMHTADMLRAFAPFRDNAIVIPGRGGRYWTDLTNRPNLDLPLGDAAMGGHAGFALGVA